MDKANTKATKNCLPNYYVLPNTLAKWGWKPKW